MRRIATALVLIPLFVYLVLWAPVPLFWASVGAVAVMTFREYANLVSLHNIQAPGLFGYVSGLVLLFVPRELPGVMILCALFALMLSLRFDSPQMVLPYASALVLGVVYIFGALRCGIELHAFSPYWLLFGLSLNWVGDIAAFYVGRSIGRHRLSTQWSPAKSWEGAIASAVGSAAYAAIYFHYLLPQVPLLTALLIAVPANVAGQFGDICESALKRGARVKDSGTLLPGHGGWLDRIDSSLFALPVVYILSQFAPAK